MVVETDREKWRYESTGGRNGQREQEETKRRSRRSPTGKNSVCGMGARSEEEKWVTGGARDYWGKKRRRRRKTRRKRKVIVC